MLTRVILALLPIVLFACSTVPSIGERRHNADQLAAIHGWRAETIYTDKFDLLAYRPSVFAKNNILVIYIEGDGLAWLSSSTPSRDPTPVNPMALRLALSHGANNVAYIGRPCQYVGATSRSCQRRYWTVARFSAEVIEATDAAINTLKQQAGARQLMLVGYSGGGAVATLLAARRSDVTRLITVAGNLDHRSWTAHHRVRPLSVSLNPIDRALRLDGLSQIHFVGTHDRVIPPELVYRWPREFRGENNVNLRLTPEYDHVCCWAENWPALLRQINNNK